MKNIAFKRAKNCPPVKDSLHPEFICEHADTSLFPEGFHKVEDGYEILSEDMFAEEFAKNDEVHAQFLLDKREKELLEQKAQEQANQKKDLEEKKARAEFEEFKAWKQSQKK